MDLTKKVEHISKKGYDLLLGGMYFTSDDGYQNFSVFPSMVSSRLKCTRKNYPARNKKKTCVVFCNGVRQEFLKPQNQFKKSSKGFFS